MKTYTNVLHNPTAKTITVLDRMALDLQRVVSIKDVLQRVVIYDRDNNIGGNDISVSANVITYDYNRSVFQENEPVIIEYEEEMPRTYSAVVKALAIANNATDILTIQGTAGKLVKIRKVEVFFRTTGQNSAIDFSLVRRSSSNTGGTSAVVPISKYDQNAPNASAVVRSYTANPATLGALVATIDNHRVAITAGNTPPAGFEEKYDVFGAEENPTLRGASDFFALNLNGFTANGTETTDLYIVWTEE